MTETRRGRGRPPAGDAADRRAAILDAARGQFAAKGFAGASMRAIARAAGVDAGLISHYFGDKSQLLVATLDLPVDPLEKITGVISGGVDGLAERLVRTFLESWDPHRDVFSTLIRTALGAADGAPPVLDLAREVIVGALMEVLEGDDREVRAQLVIGQVIGMATARYVIGMEPLASASIDEVVRIYAPGIQSVIGARLDR